MAAFARRLAEGGELPLSHYLPQSLSASRFTARTRRVLRLRRSNEATPWSFQATASPSMIQEKLVSLIE